MAKRRMAMVRRIRSRARRASRRSSGFGGGLMAGVPGKALYGGGYAFVRPLIEKVTAKVGFSGPLPNLAALYLASRFVKSPIVSNLAGAGASVEGFVLASGMASGAGATGGNGF